MNLIFYLLICCRVIRKLGTREDPTTFKIEVYGKRFLVDDFLGQV